MFRFVALAAVAAAVFSFAPLSASAQTIPLAGVVVDANGSAIAGAAVSVSGQGVNRTEQTDAAGHFSFSTLTVGRYVVGASKGKLAQTQVVDLDGAGKFVTIALEPLKEIAHAVVARKVSSARSGTDVGVPAALLAKAPTGGSMSGIIAQLPAAAAGSNGQVHVNGDHNGLNYYLDGVQLPANLNRVLGAEIDPSDIGYLEVLEGAYPAQYGDKFAAVLNIGTRAFTGPPGFSVSGTAGSFGTSDGTLGYHTVFGHGATMSLAIRSARNDRGIDPPVPDPVHNDSSDFNGFLRMTVPVNALDTVNFDLLHSVSTFQIPPDTKNGVPDATDDNEVQNDSFLALQYRHAVGDRGVLSFGPVFKSSRILDTNDLNNDLAGAAGSRCTDFSDCAYYSAYGDRLARDYRFTADYALRSAAHDVRMGAVTGVTNVVKTYAITLQPNNALNPGGGPYTVVDNAPNVAHTQEAYLQDSWRMGSEYQLDYGLRSDSFQIFSNDFREGFTQLSPRIKLTRMLTPRSSVYAYYGRLFEPFSFENVSPLAASQLYVNGAGQAFDLKPERDSLYEIGGHLPVGSADLGIRIMRKNATDWIDDTQIGATNLHQDINFPQGRVDVQTAYLQRALPRDGRAYLSLTHSDALNSLNCETKLLQNCAASGVPGGPLVQADHDQKWASTAGFVSNDRRGGWLSASAEYGSGLSQNPANCNGDTFNCKVPPHLVFNVEKGVALGQRLTLALSIENLLNDQYVLTQDNALQGTHYARPRAIFVNFDVK